jgi:hypothetical protein
MASIIDPASAQSLIQEYRLQNAAPGGPAITTHEGHLLNGYFLTRESLESILSNPKAVGVSLHLAKHPDFKGLPGNHFTVLCAAAEPNTAPDAKTRYINTGDFSDPPPPCPPSCAS